MKSADVSSDNIEIDCLGKRAPITDQQDVKAAYACQNEVNQLRADFTRTTPLVPNNEGALKELVFDKVEGTVMDQNSGLEGALAHILSSDTYDDRVSQLKSQLPTNEMIGIAVLGESMMNPPPPKDELK